MWNQFQTDAYQGIFAETLSLTGYNGDWIHAYFSRPLGEGPFPGVVLIPHAPGWDEFYLETTRRFSQHGYSAICPNIYYRFGHGTPKDVANKVRNEGGVPDKSVIGDCEGADEYLKSQSYSNRKVGVIGTCSGGRHTFLAACQAQGFDAAVNCWGGRVVASGNELTDWAKMCCPPATIHVSAEASLTSLAKRRASFSCVLSREIPVNRTRVFLSNDWSARSSASGSRLQSHSAVRYPRASRYWASDRHANGKICQNGMG